MPYKKPRPPQFAVRWTARERALIDALRRDLEKEHGKVCTTDVVRIALHQLATFRGIVLTD